MVISNRSSTPFPTPVADRNDTAVVSDFDECLHEVDEYLGDGAAHTRAMGVRRMEVLAEIFQLQVIDLSGHCIRFIVAALERALATFPHKC